MSDESQALTSVQDENALLASWGFREAGSRYLTSINGTSKQDNAAVLALLNAEGAPLVSFVDKEVNVVAYLCKPVAHKDRANGELVSFLAIMILLDNGKVIKSFSQYVLEALLDIKSKFGPPSHTNPFKVIPRTRGKVPAVSHYLDTSPMTDPLLSPQRKDK